MSHLSASDYPEDWESNSLAVGKVSIHFGYADCGWISLSVLPSGCQSLTIRLSYVYDPFEEMVEWLNKIADDDLPAKLTIDEEGIRKHLIVRRYAGRYSAHADVEFRIFGDYWDEAAKDYKEGSFLLVRTTRLQLLSEFVRRLDLWLKEDYDPKDWDEYGWEEGEKMADDLTRLDIEGLKAKVHGAI